MSQFCADCQIGGRRKSAPQKRWCRLNRFYGYNLDVLRQHISEASIDLLAPQPHTVHIDLGQDVPLNVVFFGPPGAGKGTQAERFAERHHIPKISTGDILRQAIGERTELGLIVADTLLRGALVSDDLMIHVVRERLEQPDTANGFVLDGFPRTLEQAAALDALVADRGPVIVIALVVHGDEVVRRLSRRGREDDDEWVIKERLAVYSRATEPVLEYYRRRGVVSVLDGNRPLDEVTSAIEAVVAKKG